MEGRLVWFRGDFTMGTLFWTDGLVYDTYVPGYFLKR